VKQVVECLCVNIVALFLAYQENVQESSRTCELALKALEVLARVG